MVAADLQHYLPEINDVIYSSQIAALGSLMFVAPATGLAVGIAFIQGLTGRKLGNILRGFNLCDRVDLTAPCHRGCCVMLLIPTALIYAYRVFNSAVKNYRRADQLK